jgi:hypothetical protein
MNVICPTCHKINDIPPSPGTQYYYCVYCNNLFVVTVPPAPQSNTSEAVGLIGGAVLGGAIAGPLGALIGGVLGALLGRESKPSA